MTEPNSESAGVGIARTGGEEPEKPICGKESIAIVIAGLDDEEGARNNPLQLP